MDETKLHQGSEFDDPSKPRASTNRISYSFRVIAISLLLACANFLSFVWGEKWGDNLSDVDWLHGAQTKVESSESLRWGWEPYRLEYQLYLDKGYSLDWLEGNTAQKVRTFLGDFSPFFEMFALRVYGLVQFTSTLVISFIFFLSLGSVRYHDKKFEFKHISSTFNNAAIKVLLVSMGLGLVWCSVPFGMNLPVLNVGLPILADVPFFGVLWLSSPLIGALMVGSVYCIVAFIMGANFSREI